MAFLGPELITSDLLNWDVAFLGTDCLPLCDLPLAPGFPGAESALQDPSTQPVWHATCISAVLSLVLIDGGPSPSQTGLQLLVTPPSSPDSAFPASPEHAVESVPSNGAGLHQFIKAEPDLAGMGSGASEDGDGCDAMPTAKWARTEAAGAGGLGAQDSLSLEEQSAKKQRRMLKNRESACLSRKRKKEYVETLEKQVSDSAHERESMINRISALENENARLKLELDEYRAGRKPRNPVTTAAATTTCVLAFLALFSLFASPTAPPALPTASRALAPLGRPLKPVESSVSQAVQLRVSAQETRVDDMEAWRQLQRAKLLDSETENTSTDVTLPSAEQNSTMLPVFRLSADYNAAMLHSLQRRPDTAYVLCTEVRVLSASSPSDTPRLSLIMPAPRIQTPAKNETLFTGDAVQIDCDILQSTPMTVNSNSSMHVRVRS